MMAQALDNNKIVELPPSLGELMHVKKLLLRYGLRRKQPRVPCRAVVHMCTVVRGRGGGATLS